MKKKMLVVLALCFVFSACARTQTPDANQTENKTSAGVKAETGESATGANQSENAAQTESIKPEYAESQTGEPRTVREFFSLLPPKYFTLEGCEPEKDRNCERARAEYIKTFLEVEDAKNGYWKSGCDGAQSCLTMALFKRPDESYIVHVLTEFEMGEESYFLEYKNGKWTDIGAQVIPEYSAKNTYVPPRYGTTVEVFKKNFPEPEYSERGAKIYDLQWKDGKFSKK